jgi:hypothetical protein
MEDVLKRPAIIAHSMDTYVDLGLTILEAAQASNIQQEGAADVAGSVPPPISSQAANQKQTFLERVIHRLAPTSSPKDRPSSSEPAAPHERSRDSLALLMRCVRLMGPAEDQRRFLTR